jgi:hypothetical protein
MSFDLRVLGVAHFDANCVVFVVDNNVANFARKFGPRDAFLKATLHRWYNQRCRSRRNGCGISVARCPALLGFVRCILCGGQHIMC